MPADSEDPEETTGTPGGATGGPTTWRPLGVRLSGALFGGLLMVVSVAAWVRLDPEIKAVFTPFERVTTLLIYAGAFAAWYALVRSRVTATSDRLVVVNGFKRREFAWAQVITVRLPKGAPWATVDLADGTSIPAMGIQGSDGGRARAAVLALREAIAQHSR